MLFSRQPLHKPLHVNSGFGGNGVFQFLSKFFWVNIFLKPKVNVGFRFGIHNVISFILCEILSKMLPCIVRGGMTLNGKIAPVKGVQEIKSDREIIPKSLICLAQNLLSCPIHYPIERHFQQNIRRRKNQAVFRDYHFKGPCIIRFVLWKIGDIFRQPLPSPYPGLKPRSHAEIRFRHGIQTCSEYISTHPCRTS